MNVLPNTLHIDRLHPELRYSGGFPGRLNLLAELLQLKRSLEGAKQEILFLTAERDELVRALRSWAGDAPAADEEGY
jgi:hypothetical protein